MKSDKPIIPTLEQLKVKWSDFSNDYTSMIEGSTLEGAKYFFEKFKKLRSDHKLNDCQLDIGEIACGSGKFMKHVLQNNAGFAKNIKMFDLVEDMTSKAFENLKTLPKSMNLNLNHGGRILF